MKKVCIAIIVMFAMVAVFQPQEAKSQQSKSSKEYIADLSSKDEGTIVRAADWLGKEKEEEALPRLKNLLQYDIRPNVRLHSAMAMGYIGETSSIDSLNDRLLVEQNSDVRYTILLSLTRIGVSEKKHVEVLKKARDAETDPIIKDYMEKMVAKYTK